MLTMSNHQIEAVDFNVLFRQSADSNVNPYESLGFAPNPDGSFTRNSINASWNTINPLLSIKEISVNQSKNTRIIFLLPKKSLNSSNHPTKLPLIIFFHGGGFVLGCPDSSLLNDFYTAIVTNIPAMVASVGYRLAPEHRLPAAYDDCMEALHTIKTSQEEWLTKYADFSKCLLMGGSAGGNIAYHVGLAAASSVDDLKPLEIKGLILQQPFFGGVKRTQSELRLGNDNPFPLCVNHLMWELSLPIGVDRDHEYCNPMVGIRPHLLEKIKDRGWKILVTGCDGDPLVDRQIDLVKMLEANGVEAVGKFNKGGYHGYETLDPSGAEVLSFAVKEFILSFSH